VYALTSADFAVAFKQLGFEGRHICTVLSSATFNFDESISHRRFSVWSGAAGEADKVGSCPRALVETTSSIFARRQPQAYRTLLDATLTLSVSY
jgi:hypothetical protein